MKSSYLKSFGSAALLILPLGYISAAESDTAKDAQREAALSRIELLRATDLSNIDQAERESFYSEYAGNLEAYVLNGLSRSEEETLRFYKEAYDAFVIAANNSSKDYASSSKISDLAVKLNDVGLLRNFFEPYLQTETIEQNIYIARIDFAYGLEKFGYTSEAEELLLDAMSMRSSADAYEATYRYLELLKNSNRSEEALKLLENLPEEYREKFTREDFLSPPTFK